MRSSAAGLLGLLLLAGACSDSTQPETPARLRITDGDRQTGAVGRRLPRPLEVTARTSDGSPAPGVTVRWHAEINGEVDRATSVTDRSGRASAWFTLGAQEGVAAATARTELDSAPFLLKAQVGPPPEELPYGEIRVLAISTFDGSGQTVHPDHLLHDAPGFGFPRHLAITPYPFGDARKELPSVFAGDGLLDWAVEPGAPDPVVPNAPTGHMSDPDLVYVDDVEEIWMYYRHVTSRNIINLVRSSDGRSWSEPVEVVSAPNHGIISPAVVRRGPGDWWMWYIDAGSAGCSGPSTTVTVRRSADGIAWGPPQPLAMSHEGMHPWHIEVQWIPEREEFWALYNSKHPGGCTTPAVFLAVSADGITWEHFRSPVLAKGGHPDLMDIVYRGTFLYDDARADVTFWHSGATYRDGRYVWRSAVQRLRLSDLLGLASRDDPDLADLPPAPAPLVEWP